MTEEDELLVLQMEISVIPQRSFNFCARSLDLARRLIEDKKKLLKEIEGLKNVGRV